MEFWNIRNIKISTYHLPFRSIHAKHVIIKYVSRALERQNKYETSKIFKHKNEILFQIAQLWV